MGPLFVGYEKRINICVCSGFNIVGNWSARAECVDGQPLGQIQVISKIYSVIQ